MVKAHLEAERALGALEDKFENMGAHTVREVASRTIDGAGNGS